MRRHRSEQRTWLAAITAVVLALTVAACGDDDDATTSASPAGSTSSASAASGSSTAASTASEDPGLAKAKANVEAHSKPPTSIGPTEPIGKPIPKGKHLAYVHCGAPACAVYEDGLRAAAKVLGWTVTTIPAAPTPEATQKAFDEVIRRKPDGVASAGLGSTLYPRQLAKLNAMKIPVMAATGGDPTGTNGITLDPVDGAQVSKATELAADKAIVDFNGKANIGSIHLGGYPIVEQYTQAFDNRIKANCPACTLKRLDVQPTDLGKDAPTKIANFLRANPKIDALFLSYDLEGVGLPAAVKGAGVTMPKTYSWGVETPGLADFISGKRDGAMVPDPFAEVSWQIVDGFARVFTGQSVKPDETFQEHFLWAKDLNTLPDAADPLPPTVRDYQAQFKALWNAQ